MYIFDLPGVSKICKTLYMHLQINNKPCLLLENKEHDAIQFECT